VIGWYRGGAGTAGEDEDEACKDSKFLGVIREAVALHPEKLLLFKLDLCGPGCRWVSLKIFESKLFKAF